ncbi:MAG: elongation factor Ts [Chloroflexota bacterium]
MKITADSVKELRAESGAGVMDCRNALMEAEGNMGKAIQILKERCLFEAKKKETRATSQGLVEAYIHTAGRIGAMVEVNCETDFVARTFEFKELAHNLAMQVAASSPICVTKEELPANTESLPEIGCLLLQPYIKDPTRAVQDIVNEVIAKTGENIRIKRFARFELGA